MMMTPTSSLVEYEKERDDLLFRITGILEENTGIKAAWLTGSLGRRDGDKLSDIDLCFAVGVDEMKDLLTDPLMFFSRFGKVILDIEAPQNAPEGGGYLMTCYDAPVAPHIVDWSWLPVSLAFVPVEGRLIFDKVDLPSQNKRFQLSSKHIDKRLEDRPTHFVSYFWMMLMVNAKRVYRVPWSEKIDLLSSLTDSIEKSEKYLGWKIINQNKNQPGVQAPQEKMSLLYKYADQMKEVMDNLREKGEEVPLEVIPGAYRYLDLINSNLHDLQPS